MHEKTLAVKIAHAYKVFRCMWYNPAFEEVQDLLDDLKKVTNELDKMQGLSRQNGIEKNFKAKEAELNRLIIKLHRYVEEVEDKEAAFIVSAGMGPEPI